jgi:hypothetical protein
MAAFAELRPQIGIAPSCVALSMCARPIGTAALRDISSQASPKATTGFERSGTLGTAADPQQRALRRPSAGCGCEFSLKLSTFSLQAITFHELNRRSSVPTFQAFRVSLDTSNHSVRC